MISEKTVPVPVTTHVSGGLKKISWQLIVTLLLLFPLIWYKFSAMHDTYFRQPLSVSTGLAANFGEVRVDHYHLGLDIRTLGRENLPVYAVADGFISRVLVEPGEYGKAVFISHPNGNTTVYAHLNRFNDAVESFIYKKQYHDEQWQQDAAFKTGVFPVQKGDLVGYSGNTGASQGPHLHFEVRNTKTGIVLNPLLVGFSVSDRTAPVLQQLYWYNRCVSIYETAAQSIPVSYVHDGYTSISRIVTVNTPAIGLGMEAFDQNSQTRFKLGIYKVELFMDDVLQFRFVLDSFPVNQVRYSNAGIDYGRQLATKKAIQYLFVLPGNRLPVFATAANGNGVLNLADQQPHRIKICISDAAGNTTIARLVMQYNKTAAQASHGGAAGNVLIPGKAGEITGKHIGLTFDRLAFYDTVHFILNESIPAGVHAASAGIRLHHENVPVHDSFWVRIKTTLQAQDPMRRFTVMQLTTHDRKILVKGKWQGDWMQGRFDRLGVVQLTVDTVAPEIELLNPHGTAFSSAADSMIRLLCRDNLGAIAFFRATLDGHWVLFAQKDDMFFYQPDKYCPAGPHNLQVTVKDVAGNVTTKTFFFLK